MNFIRFPGNVVRFPPLVDLRKPAQMASTAAGYGVKKKANRVKMFFSRIRKQAMGAKHESFSKS